MKINLTALEEEFRTILTRRGTEEKEKVDLIAIALAIHLSHVHRDVTGLITPHAAGMMVHASREDIQRFRLFCIKITQPVYEHISKDGGLSKSDLESIPIPWDVVEGTIGSYWDNDDTVV